jgi:hypothetical protein
MMGGDWFGWRGRRIDWVLWVEVVTGLDGGGGGLIGYYG